MCKSKLFRRKRTCKKNCFVETNGFAHSCAYFFAEKELAEKTISLKQMDLHIHVHTFSKKKNSQKELLQLSAHKCANPNYFAEKELSLLQVFRLMEIKYKKSHDFVNVLQKRNVSDKVCIKFTGEISMSLS